MVVSNQWREEDPSTICFLYSVYMQKVVLGHSARIFLEIGRSLHHVNYFRSEDPSIRDK